MTVVEVPAMPGFNVVNIGNLLARRAYDEQVSTLYRIVNPPPSIAGG